MKTLQDILKNYSISSDGYVDPTYCFTVPQLESLINEVISQRLDWIDVNERLPLEPIECIYDMVTVLVADKDHVTTASFARGGTPKPWAEWSEYNDIQSAKITHWMPLPKPPSTPL